MALSRSLRVRVVSMRGGCCCDCTCCCSSYAARNRRMMMLLIHIAKRNYDQMIIRRLTRDGLWGEEEGCDNSAKKRRLLRFVGFSLSAAAFSPFLRLGVYRLFSRFIMYEPGTYAILATWLICSCERGADLEEASCLCADPTEFLAGLHLAV